MGKTRAQVACLSLIILAMASGAWSQDYRVEENPFQGEFSYRVPNDLRPMVEVEGVRWSKLSIAPKAGKKIVVGKLTSTVVAVEMENLGRSTAVVLLVVLLEDEYGGQLDRINMSRIKISAGKRAVFTDKIKLDGEVLQETAKIWVFFEVE